MRANGGDASEITHTRRTVQQIEDSNDKRERTLRIARERRGQRIRDGESRRSFGSGTSGRIRLLQRRNYAEKTMLEILRR